MLISGSTAENFIHLIFPLLPNSFSLFPPCDFSWDFSLKKKDRKKWEREGGKEKGKTEISLWHNPWNGNELLCGIILMFVLTLWEFSYLYLEDVRLKNGLYFVYELFDHLLHFQFPELPGDQSRQNWNILLSFLGCLSNAALVNIVSLRELIFYCISSGQIDIMRWNSCIIYSLYRIFCYICEKPKVR